MWDYKTTVRVSRAIMFGSVELGLLLALSCVADLVRGKSVGFQGNILDNAILHVGLYSQASCTSRD